MGRYNETLDSYDKIIELHPESPEPYFYKGKYKLIILLGFYILFIIKQVIFMQKISNMLKQ